METTDPLRGSLGPESLIGRLILGSIRCPRVESIKCDYFLFFIKVIHGRSSGEVELELYPFTLKIFRHVNSQYRVNNYTNNNWVGLGGYGAAISKIAGEHKNDFELTYTLIVCFYRREICLDFVGKVYEPSVITLGSLFKLSTCFMYPPTRCH